MKKIFLFSLTLLITAGGAFAQPATFTDSGQLLGGAVSTRGISIGDVDGDGDLDAVEANTGTNIVWINSNGNFAAGQTLGNSDAKDISLSHLNNDGHLDIFMVTNGANEVWYGDGAGGFTNSGQSLGSSNSINVALGDIDGDGDVDAFIGNYGQVNTVWKNNAGNFTNTGQTLGGGGISGYALGDLDDDGDLDAFEVNNNSTSKVYLNEGSGIFTQSQVLGTPLSARVSLGDLDGDGDLDAFVIKTGAPNVVYLNDGNSNFTQTAQSLGGNAASRGLALGDLDGDGDLDAFEGNGSSNSEPNRVWLNDGSASFTNSGQSLGNYRSNSPEIGDFDGDGDLDVFVGNFASNNRVYLNQSPVAACDEEACIGQTLNFTATNIDPGNTYSWDFGDGGSSTDQNPSHTYTTSDNFTVMLTTTDAGLCSHFETMIVCVHPTPVASLTPTDPSCYEYNDGSVDNSMTGGAPGATFTYLWSPGNETTEDLSGLTAGTYSVTVTDPVTGCTDDDSATLTDPAQVISTFSISKD